VKNFVNMPVPRLARSDSSGSGLGKQNFNDRPLCGHARLRSGDLVKAASSSSSPRWTLDQPEPLVELWNASTSKDSRAEQVANEYVALPGEFFRQWCGTSTRTTSSDAANSSWRRPGARAHHLPRGPIFVVGAQEIYRAARVRRALIDSVGSRDKEYVELPGGHISSLRARCGRSTLAKVSGWLAPAR